ncbi:MAG: hypothetical protein C0510_00300 [Erythrobacter sp.]|nr:hypothetical protein [Erythrobacter sp.]MBA4163065.1 hypothetical protein [Erythrobacter sp.]
MEWLNGMGAGITIFIGCLGLFFPDKASAMTGLVAMTPAARAEFRGTLGVTFVFLGAIPLISESPYAVFTAGVCWLGAAVGRIISIFPDYANDKRNWSAVAFECVVASLMLSGEPVSLVV